MSCPLNILLVTMLMLNITLVKSKTNKDEAPIHAQVTLIPKIPKIFFTNTLCFIFWYSITEFSKIGLIFWKKLGKNIFFNDFTTFSMGKLFETKHNNRIFSSYLEIKQMFFDFIPTIIFRYNWKFTKRQLAYLTN